VDVAGHMTVLDADKVSVRLGEAIDGSGRISDEAVVRSIEVLRHMQEIALAYNARMRAVATYAVRAAVNHLDLLETIQQTIGLHIELIDGVEEARLAFLGMRHALPIDDTEALGVDIGGGSTEIVVAKGDRNDFITSVKLGAVILSKKHFGGDSPTKSGIKAMHDHIENELAPLRTAVKKLTFEKALISSGTAKALATMHSLQFKKRSISDVNGYVIPVRDLKILLEEIELLRNPRKIAERWDLDAKRADIILAGAALMTAVSTLFGVREWTISSYGLREGLVIDTFNRVYALSHEVKRDVRSESIANFARRLGIDRPYAQHTTHLTMQIYDQLAHHLLPGYDVDELHEMRELMRAAAFLHEAGKFLSFPRYHKHSSYLIANSSLMGFTVSEKQMIGLIVRYHRKSIATDRRDVAEIADEIANPDIELINALAAILRMGRALNRTRQQRVSAVRLLAHDGVLDVTLKYTGTTPPEVELMAIERERSVLEDIFRMELELKLKALS